MSSFLVTISVSSYIQVITLAHSGCSLQETKHAFISQNLKIVQNIFLRYLFFQTNSLQENIMYVGYTRSCTVTSLHGELEGPGNP